MRVGTTLAALESFIERHHIVNYRSLLDLAEGTASERLMAVATYGDKIYPRLDISRLPGHVEIAGLDYTTTNSGDRPFFASRTTIIGTE